MRRFSSGVTFLAGIFVGIASMLACSDDSPGNVDAATCDCPAAEPPLAGRVMVVDQTQVIAANSSGVGGAGCPQGAQMLTGSCTVDTPTGRDVTLQQSGFFGTAPLTGWYCRFKNNEANPVTIKASVACLMPTS